ncbi:aminoglycoside phosphotransferase family protein [Desulfurivibrio sp. D14AmB]|uniref:aminoglycoside phosphotransferase family protein n=1 Tax=Desulfurivibrio sp. D14AmB TaxID=3374370 RepID=UPI00376EB64A
MSAEVIGELWRRLTGAGEGPATVEVLAGDGSDRRFYRCRGADTTTLLLVLPGNADAQGLAEAAAAEAIGRHLGRAGVPVPRIHGFDPASGALLLEDLGDLLLHHWLRARPAAREIAAYYRRAIEALLLLQVKARPGFPVDACWDTRRYDRRLMRERESGYFYQALGRDWLGWGELSAPLAAEFELLAELAAGQPADFVLHRDYQCRNLMLQGDRIRIIDYQGARLGPLAYDLAALLNDPYAALAPDLRAALFDFYLARVAELLPDLDRENFRRGWYFLALQRNLQVLGAFAFLTRRRGKQFFRNYLRPAAGQLVSLLNEMPEGHRFPLLRQLAATLPEKINLEQKGHDHE